MKITGPLVHFETLESTDSLGYRPGTSHCVTAFPAVSEATCSGAECVTHIQPCVLQSCLWHIHAVGKGNDPDSLSSAVQQHLPL